MSIAVTFPSAGHHLKDAGAVYNGRQENLETIKFRDLLVAELKKLGVKIITDKDNQTNRQYQNTIQPGDGSVILDIHFNAGSETATGTECLISARDFASKNTLSYKMAEEISNTTASVVGVKNRGVKPESTTRHGKLGILHQGAGVAVLWEICFISNKEDMAKYDANINDLAISIAKICKKYDDLR